MAMYEAISLLWSDSLSGYIHPGEELELDGDIAAILLEAGHIKPAKAQAPVKRSVKPAPQNGAETPQGDTEV